MKVVAAYPLLLVLAVASTSATSVAATILDDFNAATLIADFHFDDAIGTPIESTVNSVDPLAQWNDDPDGDFANAATSGAGAFSATGKNNINQAVSYLDIGNFTEGKLYLLFDVAWNFNESIYDGAQDEEFRVSLMRDDAATASTFVTAENNFTRNSATSVVLFGNGVGAGATDTSSITLGSSGDMLTILVADLDANTFEQFYSIDDGASFTSLGVANLDPSRGIKSMRFVLNEDFSNDTLLVDRIALSYVPEPTTMVLGMIGAAILGCDPRRSTGR